MYAMNDETNLQNLKLYLSSALKLLNAYPHLIDSYVLDFFVEDYWKTLPITWQESLDYSSPEDIANFLAGETFKKSVFPLSLLSFRAACYSFSIRREAVASPDHVLLLLKKFCSKSSSTESTIRTGLRLKCDKIRASTVNEQNKMGWWGNAKDEFTKEGGQHRGLHHLFRKHVKPKKQHEIVRLAQLISMAVENLDCSYVIDVGAGQGHLSRLLSFSTNMKVIAIESENTHVNGAQRFAEQVLFSLRKQGSLESPKSVEHPEEVFNPIHVVHNISDKISSAEFEKILSESIGLRETDLDGQFALVGLHTCGNLATTLLNMFASCSRAVALFSVACCYMKLSTEKEEGVGYPLSNLVKGIDNCKLSYCAREAACHAIEKHCEKLTNGTADTLKIHCYRAVLETLIVKHYPEMRRLGLKGVKRAHEIEFPKYAERALKSTGLIISDKELSSPTLNETLKNWKRVLIFYSLRLLLASVVETIILLDRMIFLNENGIRCCLFPLFDPQISPRNHVLIAVKK